MKTAKMLDSALVLILLAAASEIASGHEIANRIHGGTEVRPGELPFMAAIFYKTSDGWKNGCGGSIIDEQHILTAAHCFFDELGNILPGLPELIQIQVGCLKLSRCKSGRFNVSDLMIYPEYKAKAVINDLAIIRLAGVIELDGESTDVIHLADDKQLCCDEQQRSLTVAGWGEIAPDSASDVLLKVNIDSIPLDECRKLDSKIDNRMICAGNVGRDSCVGDSGGPLFETDTDGSRTQVGIVSFGLGSFPDPECGLHGGAYTKVAHFNYWISDCLNQSCKSLQLS